MPILYRWKPETGFDAGTTYAGFSAQDVQAAIPEAVGQDRSGHLTLQDRPLLAAIVNAIKELASAIAGFADHFTTRDLTFTRAEGDSISAREVNAKERLCVSDTAGSTCITRAQLAAMLSAAGQSAASPPTSEPSTSPEPTEAATSSPAVVESAPPVTEPTTIIDSPPLGPEDEPEPTLSPTAAPAPTAPSPTGQ